MEIFARKILVAANRFGITELKFYIESILTDIFLDTSNVASYILFADSYTCALLREKSMDLYKENPIDAMTSDGWTELQQLKN